MPMVISAEASQEGAMGDRLRYSVVIWYAGAFIGGHPPNAHSRPFTCSMPCPARECCMDATASQPLPPEVAPSRKRWTVLVTSREFLPPLTYSAFWVGKKAIAAYATAVGSGVIGCSAATPDCTRHT